MGICNYLQHVIYNLIYDNRTQVRVDPNTRADAEQALYYPARKLDLIYTLKNYKLSYPEYTIIKDSLHNVSITDEELFSYFDYFITHNIQIYDEKKWHLMSSIIRTDKTLKRLCVSNNNMVNR